MTEVTAGQVAATSAAEELFLTGEITLDQAVDRLCPMPRRIRSEGVRESITQARESIRRMLQQLLRQQRVAESTQTYIDGQRDSLTRLGDQNRALQEAVDRLTRQSENDAAQARAQELNTQQALKVLIPLAARLGLPLRGQSVKSWAISLTLGELTFVVDFDQQSLVIRGRGDRRSHTFPLTDAGLDQDDADMIAGRYGPKPRKGELVVKCFCDQPNCSGREALRTLIMKGSEWPDIQRRLDAGQDVFAAAEWLLPMSEAAQASPLDSLMGFLFEGPFGRRWGSDH